MKILVTGGLGFIGSNFILHVLENYPNLEIINLDAELIGSNVKSLDEIEKSSKYTYVKGNINDKEIIESLVEQVDGVVNFAAESHVDRSIFDSKPFLVSNIMGVYTILDVIRKKKPDVKFLQISTDEVFGSLDTGFAKEKDIFKPSNPYSASKASAELIAESYQKTYGIDISITRCTNNFGPRQFAEKLIPKTIILANNNSKIPIYGEGKNIRDWIFVDDHCDGIFSCLLHGKSGQSYNISGNNELDNIKIVKTILSLMNKSEDQIQFVEDRPGHDFRYSMDSSKISNEFNWKAKTSFEDGLMKTIHWYNQNEDIWKDTSSEILNPTPWKK